VVKSGTDKVENIRKIAYQGLIDTVIAACTFASEGKLEQLKKVKETTNVNLNDGDYDRRTPLHVSCGAGKEDVVRYLVEEMNVNVNPIDRWGATPLNDCSAWPKLEKYLISKGAKLGKLQGAYTPFVVSITEDQFRIYYAAYFGDVEMMDNLRLLGWNVNGQDYDGRTAVGIAASEGHLDVIKYLISKGADLTIKDARGNDALGDARRENRTEVIKYLVNEALILVHCLDFE
jgi:ankyrin repeat protein